MARPDVRNSIAGRERAGAIGFYRFGFIRASASKRFCSETQFIMFTVYEVTYHLTAKKEPAIRQTLFSNSRRNFPEFGLSGLQ